MAPTAAFGRIGKIVLVANQDTEKSRGLSWNTKTSLVFLNVTWIRDFSSLLLDYPTIT